jgi:hypothetical protein
VKAAFTGAIVLALVFSASPCLSQDDTARKQTITEGDVRNLSARQYTVILVTACNNGWRFPLKRVESGFRRHLNELRLQLLSDGYTIVSPSRSIGERRKPSAKVATAGIRKSKWAGCARPYWLETHGQIPAP